MTLGRDYCVTRDNGQCLFDLVSKENRDRSIKLAESEGDGWLVPPNPMPADTPEEDRRWCDPRRVPLPIKTVQQPVRLIHDPLPMPISYIYCNRDNTFEAFAIRAREEGWDYHELDSSHNPHITMPEQLTKLLDKISTL